MRNWINVLNEQAEAGPLSRHRIRNSGTIGQLEDALCLWVEGRVKEAAPHIMSLRNVASQFTQMDGRSLYRGLVVTDDEWRSAIDNGFTVHHRGKVLESWTTDLEACRNFMHGFEQPWFIVMCNENEVDVVIDLEVFDEQANPFTRMGDQHEVIVEAVPSVHYPVEDIMFEHGPDR